jgi:hypothetical protein
MFTQRSQNNQPVSPSDHKKISEEWLEPHVGPQKSFGVQSVSGMVPLRLGLTRSTTARPNICKLSRTLEKAVYERRDSRHDSINHGLRSHAITRDFIRIRGDPRGNSDGQSVFKPNLNSTTKRDETND